MRIYYFEINVKVYKKHSKNYTGRCVGLINDLLMFIIIYFIKGASSMKILSIFIILISLYSNKTLAEDLNVKEFPFMNYKERIEFMKTQIKSTTCKDKEYQNFIRELVMTYVFSANEYDTTSELNEELIIKKKETKSRALVASVLGVTEFVLLAKLLFIVDKFYFMGAAALMAAGDGAGLVMYVNLGTGLMAVNLLAPVAGVRTAIYFSKQIYSNPSILTREGVEAGVSNGDLVEITRKDVRNVFNHLDNQNKKNKEQIDKEFEYYEYNQSWYNFGWDSYNFLEKWKNYTSSKKEILKQKGSIAFSLAKIMIESCQAMAK